jgi:hypothetical protein
MARHVHPHGQACSPSWPGMFTLMARHAHPHGQACSPSWPGMFTFTIPKDSTPSKWRHSADVCSWIHTHTHTHTHLTFTIQPGLLTHLVNNLVLIHNLVVVHNALHRHFDFALNHAVKRHRNFLDNHLLYLFVYACMYLCVNMYAYDHESAKMHASVHTTSACMHKTRTCFQVIGRQRNEFGEHT